MLVDVSHIPELTDIKHTEAGVRFGASCTLSNMEHELASAVEREPGSVASFTGLQIKIGPPSIVIVPGNSSHRGNVEIMDRCVVDQICTYYIYPKR